VSHPEFIEKDASHSRLQQPKIIFLGNEYFVLTVRIDERIIRKYSRNQEQNNQKTDQGRLFWNNQLLYQLNYRFERFTMEASGFAGGLSLVLLAS